MDKTELIKKEAEELLKKMVDQFELEVKEENGTYFILIKSENPGTIIGRHGETIRSLQKILEVIFFKRFGESITILVNINDYREKQKERLEKIAANIAQKVIETKNPKRLSSFSNYERKIIHEFITKNYPQLTSYSVGEGLERTLVVEERKKESS